MCGICGIYRVDGGPVDLESLGRMTSVIQHRGPDGAGSYVADGIGLGHRRLSIKPLYYVDLGARFIFASEIKALLVDPECPKEVDLKALGELFTLRYVPSPDTLFHRIKKLPPAHLMTVGPEGCEIRRYWNWTPQIRAEADEAELIETYQWLVED